MHITCKKYYESPILAVVSLNETIINTGRTVNLEIKK